jgi:succinate dehydrogenase / fumarate reductase cytochrome b subunit
MSYTDDIHARRPTSPHLSIYKKQISSVLSIFHRLTGIMLFLGFSLIAWWMVFWVFSKFDVHVFNFTNNLLAKLLLYSLSFALFYHLCTGIRHLFWDMGYGYSLNVMHKTGWAAVICAFILTIILWVII